MLTQITRKVLRPGAGNRCVTDACLTVSRSLANKFFNPQSPDFRQYEFEQRLKVSYVLYAEARLCFIFFLSFVKLIQICCDVPFVSPHTTASQGVTSRASEATSSNDLKVASCGQGRFRAGVFVPWVSSVFPDTLISAVLGSATANGHASGSCVVQRTHSESCPYIFMCAGSRTRFPAPQSQT